MADNRAPKRWLHHAGAASLSLVILTLTATFGPDESGLDHLSLATAYICLLLMAVALSLGPLQARRTGRSVANMYLRRDMGIWAGMAGLTHLIVATELSMTQAYMSVYVDALDARLSESLRADLFAWGSIIGFAVGILLILLLGLSNDRILRRLGVTRWKRLQRLAYLAFALTVAHGWVFQALEARSTLLIGVVLGVAIGVLLLQVSTVLALKRRG